MDRWLGKIAVITGASSGIGAAIAIDLAKCGVITIGLARRTELIDELNFKLPENNVKKIHSYKCDISNEDEILKAFKWIEDKFGGIDILVNNAGILRSSFLTDKDNSKDLRDVINVNLLGLLLCTREAVQSMKKRKFNGHIIHINSIAGHIVPFHKGIPPANNAYAATKHAVTAVSECHRQELLYTGTEIKVTSISPGAVLTDIFDMTKNQAYYENMKFLNPEDVSQAVIYVLGTPPHVQVHELTLKPIGEIF